MIRKLVLLICVLQVCLTWVGAQDEVSVSPGEVMAVSESQERAADPAQADQPPPPEDHPTAQAQEQNDEPQTQPPAVALVTEVQKDEATNAAPDPTRAPNVKPTSPPPLVHSTSTDQVRNSSPSPPQTTKDPKGNAATMGANLVLLVLSASTLRFVY